MSDGIGKSVRARLLNISKTYGEKDGFMKLLVRYLHERLIYRISVSRYRENFFLKGIQSFRYRSYPFYIIDRYDAFWDYYEYRKVYDDVKAIVYEEPNRQLSETKAKLEQLTKSSSEKQFQYAFLYACAVIEWHLTTNKA